jgi:hypothetical protein
MELQRHSRLRQQIALFLRWQVRLKLRLRPQRLDRMAPIFDLCLMLKILLKFHCNLRLKLNIQDVVGHERPIDANKCACKSE